jgi:nickel-dependent lactate racemase
MNPTEPRTWGIGGPAAWLNEDELRPIIDAALAQVPASSRVLAIVPDRTRDDNTHLLFPLAARTLQARGVTRFDAIVAQGTHPPMSDAQKREKIGARDGVAVREIYDHQWDDPRALVRIGELAADRVASLTDGLIGTPVVLELNARLAPGEYDVVLVFGATVPHEVAGFAGGAKYFFPGVAGPALTHLTHWLGALATIERVIGRIETPTRRLIEAAAAFVSANVISFTSVVSRDGGGLRTHALFAGDLRAAFRRAAEVSRQVHIKYTGRSYRRVIALLDPHYDELWVGGKASYKLGAIVEEGGELVIVAPHLREISSTHGRLIEKYGYAPLEQVRDMIAWSDELRANLCVAAHLAHVSYGSARNVAGAVVPRFRITLASSVSEAACRRVKLGFADYRELRLDEYAQDPDTLVVPDAGRDLYLPQMP